MSQYAVLTWLALMAATTAAGCEAVDRLHRQRLGAHTCRTATCRDCIPPRRDLWAVVALLAVEAVTAAATST